MRHRSAAVHLAVALVVGVAVGATGALLVSWGPGLLAGWLAAALSFLLLTWPPLWAMSADETANVALRQDPGGPLRDVVLLAVASGSILAVALVIIPAGRTGWPMVAMGVASVVVSWVVVHTVFTLRYARRFYTTPKGGIDFHEDGDPSYRDFAYFSFTVGMTFQVSDTDITDRDIRSTVLRQGLTSFVYATIIIAVTINVIAGLGTPGG